MINQPNYKLNEVSHEGGVELPEEEEKKEQSTRKTWIIRGVILLALIVIIIVVIFEYDWVKSVLQDFLKWVEDHPVLGPFLLCLIYVMAVIFFLPGSILTIGSGLALKQAYESTWRALLIGSIAVWIGASIGATCAFLLGRYVFKESVEKLSQKYLIIRAIDKAIHQEGLKLMLLLRLCPLIPFNAMNYLMGITDIRLLHYNIGHTAMIPGTIVYVFIGTTISDIADAAAGTSKQGTLILVMAIVGSILALAVIIWVSVVAKRNLNRYLAQEEQVNEEGNNNEAVAGSQQVA